MNRKKLEVASDLQINVLIAKHEQIDVYLDDEGEFLWERMAGQHGDDVIYDPCNNPSDMMPLVFKAEINLNTDVMCSKGGWTASSRDLNYGWSANWQVTHKNPLRAAAIVWLLMRGKQ